MKLHGIGASPGIAVGRALVIESDDAAIVRVAVEQEMIDREAARLDTAREAARAQLLAVRDRVAKSLGESYAQVFDAQLLILDDKALVQAAIDHLRSERVNAEWSLQSVVAKLLRVFSEMKDPYIRERGGDIEDVHFRLQKLLAGRGERKDLSHLTEDTIIVAHSLSPSEAAALHVPHVVGLAIDVGGRTSHTAILARAAGIPAVLGLHDACARIHSGDLVVVDAEAGTLELAPAPEALAASAQRRAEIVARTDALFAETGLPAVTADGVPIAILANIEFPEELPYALTAGAAGVGLYRSEFLYLTRSPDLPTEDEHFEAYREILAMTGGRETVIRTLDLGGEKYFHAVLDKESANPVLGLRAIRFCLKRTDVFRSQLRGLLRASAGKNLRVMLPLISGVGELRAARTILEGAKAELRAEGVPHDPDLDLGIMIEVPSAAVISDILAKEARFFSIGTNDLIQYALAIDRGNESVAYLYQPLHPAILRMLAQVVNNAAKAGIDVSVCGEMAADPRATPVLVGLGIRKLSMSAGAIPAVRAMVRGISAARAKTLASKLLEMATAEEIDAELRAWLHGLGPSAESGEPARPSA